MKNREAETVTGTFKRPVKVDKVKSKGLRENIKATDQECLQLAEQMSVNKVGGLAFNCILMPWKKSGVELAGTMTATVEEICVVTVEPFTTEISQEVKRYFEVARQSKAQNPLLDLESIEDDVPDLIENSVIDIGDVAVETLALCLSPHPRKPDAVFTDHVESAPETSDRTGRENPFSVLKALKKH